MSQEKKQMVRLAKIKVDPLQLDKYNQALKEQMKAAIRLEPGVLTFYAVADKKEPSQITILEIYADTVAYQLHIATPHFKKNKEKVKDIVKVTSKNPNFGFKDFFYKFLKFKIFVCLFLKFNFYF